MGIGTDDPSSTLHIQSTQSKAALSFDIDNSSGNQNQVYTSLSFNDSRIDGPDHRAWTIRHLVKYSETPNALAFWANANGPLLVQNSKVIIGVNDGPAIADINDENYLLNVNGSIRAKEIVVETGWADFVFDNSYDLKPLNEVEAYINEYHHLPEVSSAKEIQENGLPIAEVTTQMMQKIEELTLYLIEQGKEIAKLRSEFKEKK